MVTIVTNNGTRRADVSSLKDVADARWRYVASGSALPLGRLSAELCPLVRVL
jgi:hypothetical protein